MQTVQAAIASLAAAKARFFELVEPEKEIAARVEAVIHATVQELEAAFARIGALEQRIKALEPEAAKPIAGADAPAAHSAPTADAAPAPAPSTGS